MRYQILIALLCIAAVAPLPKKRTVYKSATVTQGSGATALLSIVPPKTNYWIVTLGWTYTNLNDVTNFVMYSGGNSRAYTTNWYTGKLLTNIVRQTKGTYRFYTITAKGTNGESDYSNEIGYPPTNIVYTITGTGTNLLTATSLRGPWTKLNTTNYSITNPPSGLRLYRGIGKSSSTVTIKRTLQ